MTATVEQLREKRNAAHSRITELAKRLETKDAFSADELRDWNAANKDFDKSRADLAVAQKRSQMDRDDGARAGGRHPGREDTGGRTRRDRVQHTEEQRSLALKAWTRAQMGMNVSREQRDACKALRFDPRSPQLQIGLMADSRFNAVGKELRNASADRRGDILNRETRAGMTTQVPGTGGYLIAPGTLSTAFELNLLQFGGVLDVAETITTQSGEAFLWPTVDDTANSGALIGENTNAISTSTNPAISRKRWDAYKFTSTAVLVPTELLEDNQYNLDSALGEMLGVRLGRGIAPYLATGTGASQPEGIVTGSELGVTTAGGTAITFDELVRMVHSVDPAYRSMPGVGWLMHDSIVSYIRRIKDSQNRPLWTTGEFWNSGMQDGTPPRLLGYQVNVCQEMAAATAGTGLPVTATKSLLFGLLPRYKVRRVRDVRMYRLTERYRDTDQDGFVAFMRLDGKLLNAGTNPVKHLLQA